MSELWDLGTEQWQRDPATGRFSVESFRGLGPPSAEWPPADIGRLVAARAGAGAEIFPAAFGRSPLTGAVLPPAPAAADLSVWLPPYGESDATELSTVVWLGLPRTHRPLVLDLNRYPPDDPLNPISDIGLAPADTLPMPSAGSYFFAVERFGCVATTLVAIEHARGLLFAWMAGSRRWVELTPRKAALPECSLRREMWGVQLTSSSSNDSPALVLPTDSGLAVVRVDILALTYTVELIEGFCVGAPLLIDESIAAPVAGADGVLHLLTVSRQNPKDFTRTPIPNSRLGQGVRFNRAFAERRMAVWLSDAGQLLYRPAESSGSNRMLTVPWPEGVAPSFEFGAPYLSNTGRLWLLTRNSRTAAYEYHLLGHSSPEVYPVRSPKLCTGGSVFHLETQLRGEPWLEQDTDDTGARELLIPLLESVPSRSVLRVRVEGAGGMSTAAVLRSQERQRVVFELDGAGGKGPRMSRFHVARISQPWLTQALLYEGRLYLYHPGSSAGIPGWAVQ